MATELLDAPPPPKADKKPKADAAPHKAAPPLTAGWMPGDIVWYWMEPQPGEALRPYPAMLVERNRLEPDRWDVSLVKRQVTRGLTASASLTPAPCRITIRDPKLLRE